MELGERVGQRSVRRPRTREAGRVVVAGDGHQRLAVGPDLPHGPLRHPVGAVAGPGVVEHIPQPQHDVGLERQGQIDRRLERLLEVMLPLIGAVGRGAAVVLPPEMGIAQGYDSGHSASPLPKNHARRASNDMLVTLPKRYDSYTPTKVPTDPCRRW